MDIRDAARVLGVQEWTMRRRAPRLLGAEKRAGRWHIPTSTVARMVAERAEQSIRPMEQQ